MNLTLRLFGQELFSIDFNVASGDGSEGISLSDLGSIQLITADEQDEEIEDEPEARRRIGF